MKKIRFIMVVAAIILGWTHLATAVPAHVGIVKSVMGQAQIIRGSQTISAEVNVKLEKGDLVETGLDGKIGLVFEDDTVVSMGPKSQFRIEEFLFQPAQKKLSFVARMIQGTASFLSGQIAKLAPHMVRLETPDATIGLRGTHVLVKVESQNN